MVTVVGHGYQYEIMNGIDKVRQEVLFTRVGERQDARTRLAAGISENTPLL